MTEMQPNYSLLISLQKTNKQPNKKIEKKTKHTATWQGKLTT